MIVSIKEDKNDTRQSDNTSLIKCRSQKYLQMLVLCTGK